MVDKYHNGDKRDKVKQLLFHEHLKKDHFNFFYFKQDFFKFAEGVSPDIPNLVTLTQLGMCTESSTYSTPCSQVEDCLEQPPQSPEQTFSETTTCVLMDGRFQGKFVSENGINLSARVLTVHEISLLSKGLKFVPTPSSVNKARLKEELEIFGRRLLIKCFF